MVMPIFHALAYKYLHIHFCYSINTFLCSVAFCECGGVKQMLRSDGQRGGLEQPTRPLSGYWSPTKPSARREMVEGRRRMSSAA